MVSVPFHKIHVNTTPNGKEIVFKYEDKFYRMDWANVPDKFKQLYVAKLKLEGIAVPEDLASYDVGTFDLSDTNIELDLNSAEEISATYPL